MDKLDDHLNPSKQPYHPAIQAAMRLARNKINRYYSMTDRSSAYRIAMGTHLSTLCSRINTASVLHPGLKLEYFRQKDWEDEWVDNAEELVREAYCTHYEGKDTALTTNATTETVSTYIIDPI
jgi:hypothetical protein